METLQSSPDKPLVGNKEKSTRITGGVEIVCLAFSLELYIKDLLCVVKGKAPREHSILKLFKKLPEEIELEVFSYDAISKNPFITRGNLFSAKRFTSEFTAYDGFVEKIQEISDGFENWRYSYERTAVHYDTSFALTLIESIKSVAGKVRK